MTHPPKFVVRTKPPRPSETAKMLGLSKKRVRELSKLVREVLDSIEEKAPATRRPASRRKKLRRAS